MTAALHATRPKSFLTLEQYLEIERKAEFRSEYLDGEIFALAGARDAHNLLVASLIATLRQQLRSKPCRVYPSDMRVHIKSTGLYTQSIESLREYLLVSSDRVHADLYSRRNEGRWLLTSAHRLEDSLTLESVGARIVLSDLYERVEFAE